MRLPKDRRTSLLCWVFGGMGSGRRVYKGSSGLLRVRGLGLVFGRGLGYGVFEALHLEDNSDVSSSKAICEPNVI